MKPLIILTLIIAATCYALAGVKSHFTPVESARATYQVKYDTNN